MRGQKPPVISIHAGQRVEQRDLLLLATGMPGKSDQPEYACAGREHHHVARKLGKVFARSRKRRDSRGVDEHGKQLDVCTLLAWQAAGQFARSQHGLLCRFRPGVELQCAAERRVRQRKPRIGRNRALERVHRARIGRQKQVDTLHIGIARRL